MCKGFWQRQRDMKEQWEHYKAEDSMDPDPIWGGESPPRILFEDTTIEGLSLEVARG